MSDLKFTTAEEYMRVDYSTRVPFTRHGGAYDRGQADSYYGRNREPHYFTGSSYVGIRLDAVDMSAEEIAAYNQGYDDNETSGSKKDY
jgi:hypothetical protein